MIGKHHLSAAMFDALAAGRGDAATVEMLWNAQLSKHLLRLRALLELPRSLDPDAFDLLAQVQNEAPETVAGLLRYPHVAAWSAACLRRMHDSHDDGDGIDADLAHLGGIAAAAAVRAGLEFTATIAVRGGIATLPTLGSAEVGPGTFDGTALVRSGPHGVEVRTAHRTVTLPADPQADAPGWRGLRRLRAVQDGHVLEVCLDDLDPFRDNHRLGPAPRLDEQTVRRWRRALDGAWSILVRHHPARAEAIAAGLTAFVPLATEGGQRGLSATSADAPGAVAITPPGDPLLLAESLVHEFQHAKLCAVLDLVPLYTTRQGERFYAPWRDDPRPLGGLLQGAYAHLGVIDFWGRQQRILVDDEAAFAQYAFALWRDQTLRAIRAIEDSGRLTPVGARFVAGMRAAVEQWTDTPVAPESREQAEDAAADHRLTWRLRHLRHDPGAVDRLARSWPAGTPPPMPGPAELMTSELSPGTPGARAELRHLRLRYPADFRRLYASRGTSRSNADEADLAQVGGDFAAAMKGHGARLAVDPHDDEAWSGLAVSAWRGGAGAAAQVLSTLPELVATVHRRIGELGAGAPDPLELASWLEPTVRTTPRSWTASAGSA
ncbi:HEXXH motif domain-containing protein [Actinomadura scrupuli]|uniref:HEXXH motif domain-containing protein n=1 Tax=Actinomadura scrupuli TaxID=559629 RepID=UPI003D992886